MAVERIGNVLHVDVASYAAANGVGTIGGVSSFDAAFGVANIVTTTPADRPVLTAAASTTHDNRIVLSWTAPPQTGITGYVLQRKLKTATVWSTIYSGAALSTTNDGQNLTEYSYRVRADRGSAEGAWSVEVDWLPILRPPGNITGLTITPTGPTSGGDVRAFTWNASARASGYQWELRDGGDTRSGTTTATRFLFVIQGAEGVGVDVNFRIRATRTGASPSAWAEINEEGQEGEGGGDGCRECTGPEHSCLCSCRPGD